MKMTITSQIKVNNRSLLLCSFDFLRNSELFKKKKIVINNKKYSYKINSIKQNSLIIDSTDDVEGLEFEFVD